MTGKMRHAINTVVENINSLTDEEHAQFMDDLICNLEVNLDKDVDFDF